jgi:hypothetical protein
MGLCIVMLLLWLALVYAPQPATEPPPLQDVK